VYYLLHLSVVIANFVTFNHLSEPDWHAMLLYSHSARDFVCVWYFCFH